MPNHLLQAASYGLKEDLVEAHGTISSIPLDVEGGHGGVANLQVFYTTQWPWIETGLISQISEGLC